MHRYGLALLLVAFFVTALANAAEEEKHGDGYSGVRGGGTRGPIGVGANNLSAEHDKNRGDKNEHKRDKYEPRPGAYHRMLSRKRCGENEEFTNCGTACEPSCKQPKPRRYVKRYCVIDCQCKDGYVRNKERKCVKPCEC